MRQTHTNIEKMKIPNKQQQHPKWSEKKEKEKSITSKVYFSGQKRNTK